MTRGKLRSTIFVDKLTHMQSDSQTSELAKERNDVCFHLFVRKSKYMAAITTSFMAHLLIEEKKL